MEQKNNQKRNRCALGVLVFALLVLSTGCVPSWQEPSTDEQMTSTRNTVVKNDTPPHPVAYPGDHVSCMNGDALATVPTEDAEQVKVMQIAREILDDITADNMTDMEVAFAIYNWTRTNITYVGTSDKSCWSAGAYQAFTECKGDCYTFFAAAKALYLAAGIDNVDVVRQGAGTLSHYWSLINLGDGWYHVDCTPRRKGGHFFMNTDAELAAYSAQHKGSHSFDGSLYPPRATKSVQYLVDHEAGKIRG